MILEHVLTDFDSLQSLALKYLGDASRGREIADYNKLNYPYVLQDKHDLEGFFGSGYVTVTRANYQTSALIKEGWTFKTKSGPLTRNTIRIFEVSEDTNIPAGVQSYKIPLRCTVPGSFGNVIGYTITEVGENTKQLSNIQFLSVYNEQQFSGGRPLNVAIVGSTLYIPTESNTTAPDDAVKMLALIGGEDLVLDDSGNLVIEDGGDLASAYGMDNIRYAIASRLKSELGDLLYHPEYGTPFQDLIGRPNLSNRENLMKIAVYRSLAQESRISEVSISSLVVDGTSVLLDIAYKIAISGVPDNMSIAL